MVVRTAARGRPEGAPAPRRRPGQGLATQARVPRVAPLPAAGKGRRRLTTGLPVSPRHSAARARGPVSGCAGCARRGPSYGADASSPSWLLRPASFLPSVRSRSSCRPRRALGTARGCRFRLPRFCLSRGAEVASASRDADAAAPSPGVSPLARLSCLRFRLLDF